MVKKYIPFARLCNNTVTVFVIKSIWGLGIIVGVIDNIKNHNELHKPIIGEEKLNHEQNYEMDVCCISNWSIIWRYWTHRREFCSSCNYRYKNSQTSCSAAFCGS
ncbi:hypothetical protein D3C76_1326740 [compost metagenome]